MRKKFEDHGYLVIEDFVPSGEVTQLKQRASKLVDDFDPSESRSVFHSLWEGKKKAINHYIRSSGDKIRFFLEPKALDEHGMLNRPKHQAICKIGHALHDLDPVFDRFSRSDKIRLLASELGFTHPLVAQSMYFFKHPRIGGKIQLHQDATFLYTEPSSVLGLWFALEDATIHNACLWVLPGGHKLGLKQRFLSTEAGEEFVQIGGKSPYNQADFVPLEVKQGSLVVLHGFLPHFSRDNLSANSRQAYTIHLIEGQRPYAADNWLQRSKQFPFRGF